jgi:excinuclease UvrABC helicase subunit UvrB
MKKRMPTLFEKYFSEDLDDLFENSLFFSKRISFPRKEMSFPEDKDKNYNKTEEVFEDETHVTKTEKWVSTDGSRTFTRTTSESKSKPKAKEMSTKEIKVLLDKAVENQDFEKAIELRDKLKSIEAKK